MGAIYLICLVIALAGLAVIDARYRLVLWRHPRAAVKVLAAGVAGFIVWDLAGIALGIFFPGRSAYVTGLLLAPGLPIEEIFFLTLLCYLSLIIWEYER
jgi:lycopene cyclase domain-containing protein